MTYRGAAFVLGSLSALAASSAACGGVASEQGVVPASGGESGAACAATTAGDSGAQGDSDFANIFGAGIGLDLNDASAICGTEKKQPYDAPEKRVIGVSFDFEAASAPGLRVEFPFSAEDAGVWRPDARNYASPIGVGHNILLFANVAQPAFVAGSRRVPFDASTLTAIRFHVVTSRAGAAAYQFCVDNLALIIQP